MAGRSFNWTCTHIGCPLSRTGKYHSVVQAAISLNAGKMKLFCRKYGNGPPLIILHGLFGSSDNWVTIAKNLSDSFTVYLPDQRNHGQSPHSDVHDYDSMRDDLFELVNDLSLKKFFLAGHSMGGKTAISFALKWPEMLNGLLIADISPFVNKSIG